MSKNILLFENITIIDNRGLAESLKEQKVAPDETLVCFDVSVLFTSSPVPVALEVINGKFTHHINKRAVEKCWEHNGFIPKDSVMLCYIRW